MTKSEALEFLELPETATDSEIKIRIEEKLAYFERLSEKAPSDFLKRLHARNAVKVSEIQLLAKKWPSYVAEVVTMPEAVVKPEAVATPEPELSSSPDPLMMDPEPEFVKEGDEIILTPEPVGAVEPALTPLVQPEVVVAPEAIAEAKVVAEAAITADPVVRPEAAITAEAVVKPEAVAATETEPAPVAWLIRHTENQSAKTFPIYPGKNYLGRKPRPDLVPFIEVEEDPYISKVHAVLFADKASVYIGDPSGDEGKPSKNGIFLNADDNRLKETTRLKENDTVQIGVTKLILRYNNQTIVKIVQEVQEQDYMHTVVIDIA